MNFQSAQNQQPNDDHLFTGAVNSILPGCILATLFRDPETTRTLNFEDEEMDSFNTNSHCSIVTHFQSHGFLTKQAAVSLTSVLSEFENAFRVSTSSLSLRAAIFGYNADAANIVFQSLLSVNAFVHVLQIVTPADRTYLKTESLDIDVLEMLHNSVLNFAAGVWCKLVRKNQGIPCCWGTRQLWTAAFQEHPDECLESLEAGLQIVEEQGIAHFIDLLEGGDNFVDSLNESYEINEDLVNQGLDEQFRRVGLACQSLGLQPVSIKFFRWRLNECMWAYAKIDDNVSHSDKRFCENLSMRIASLVDEYADEMEEGNSDDTVQEEDFQSVLDEREKGLATREKYPLDVLDKIFRERSLTYGLSGNVCLPGGGYGAA